MTKIEIGPVVRLEVEHCTALVACGHGALQLSATLVSWVFMTA
jgi:hypothetical protein